MNFARALGLMVLLCLGGRGADPRSAPSMLAFTLQESAESIQRRLGPVAHSAWGRGYSVLEFGQDSSEHNDLGYEWTFYFAQPSGELLSVTHNLQPPRSVTNFFPAAETRVHSRAAGSTAIS